MGWEWNEMSGQKRPPMANMANSKCEKSNQDQHRPD